MRAAARAAVLLCLLPGVVAGCGSNGDEEGDAGGSPTTVEKTRVRVVEELGKDGGFDASSLYRQLSPGVVTVISTFDGARPLADRDGEGGLGSGFVLDGAGFVATNAHVVTSGEGDKLKRANQVFVDFADGNRVGAKIIGADPNSDVALLKVDPGGLTLTPIQLGSSTKLRVGEPVAAIGSPFGERQSLSVGVISALDRDIESLTAFQIGNAIQTDAAINQGNSGGPLLDGRGRVIGINAQIRSTSGGGVGVGFAIPVDAVKRSLDELREDGKVEYAFLGVTSQQLYPQLADHLGIRARTGALIVKVEEGSPADKAALEAGRDKTEFQAQKDIPRGGDVITKVGGRPLTNAANLADLISAKSPGDQVRLEVLRGNDRREVTVTLAERPARAPQD